MEEKELIAYLKKNLSVQLDTTNEGKIEVTIKYKDIEICSDHNWLKGKDGYIGYRKDNTHGHV